MIKKNLCFSLLFVCTFLLNAQNFVFKNYTTADGLSSNYAMDIIKDDNNYIWIVTANGLSKFNGSTFKNFTTDNGLSSNLINFIFKDSQNRIWVGTQNGGANFIHNDVIVNLNSKFRDRCKFVTNFLERPNGNILIFSSCGIFEYQNDELIKISVEEDELFNLAIKKGAWLDDNTILVATTQDGLHKVSLSPYKTEKIKTDPGLNNICYTVIRDSDGMFWVGTYGELVRFDSKSESIIKYKFNSKEFNSNRVRSIYELNSEELLLGLEGNGIVVFNKSSGDYSMYNKENGMPSDYIYGVTQDFEGNIWAADLEQGLIGFRDRSTTYLDRPEESRSYREIIREGQDSVLVASSYGLLRLVNNVVTDTVIKDINITTFSKIKNKEYLISKYRRTGEHEYYRTYRYEDFLKKELVAKGMYAYSYVDNDLTFLPGYGEYLVIRPDTTYKIAGPETTNFFKIADNQYIIGARAAALRFDKKQITVLDSLYPDARVYNGYTQISDGSIFAADADDGLYHISYKSETNSYSVRAFSYDQFGIYEIIDALASDEKYLWIASKSTLKRVDIDNLLSRDSVSLKSYPLDKTLLKNGFDINKLRFIDSGLLYGISLGKLVIFNEQFVKSSTKEPLLNLSSILLFSENLDENKFRKNDVTELPYDQNYLTFNMEAITYTYPESIRFKYKLKGLRNSEWSESVNENKVVYSYLPPGDYSFEFVADNGNGIWAETPYSFPFVIKAPFWRLPWFWVITILGISGFTLLYVLRRNKIKELQAQKFSQDLITAQEEERTRISKDLHDSVGQQLTLIKKKAQTLNQEELSKMSNDALEEVRSISRDLYPATLKQLGFTQSVEQLVNDLDEGVDMFFTFEVDEIDNDLDEEKSLNLYRFIQESLSNVIKHSNAKAVSVTITKNLNQIEAIISDNGKGFNSAVVKNSLGLKTMAERIKMLKGTLSIKSRVDQGTTLIAQIPV